MAMPGRLSLDDERYLQALHYSETCDKHKDGTMSRTDLAVALRAAFPTCTSEEIERLIRSADLNGDGVIQYQEFWDWVRLEPRERFSFQDQVRILQRAGRHELESPPPAEPAADGRSDSRAGAAPSLTRSASSEDGSFIEIIERFTHPLLSRFTVCDASPSKAGKVVVRPVLVSSHHEGSAQLVPSSAGQPRLEVSIPRLPMESGASRFLDKLESVASAFARIFEVFCTLEDHTALVAVPEGAPLLLEAFQLEDDARRPVQLAPEVFWSGAALALVRMRPAHRNHIQRSSIEVVARTTYKDALDSKVRMGSEVLRIDATECGRLRNVFGNYEWVMKKNDAEARLLRMQAFFDTQHAASEAGVLLPPSGPGERPRKLALHTEQTVAGVFVREEPVLKAPAAPVTSASLTVKLPEDIPGYTGRSTAMEVASFLVNQGKRVVAVNAASAYHVGGGVTTGGRHALEEAWCITSTLFRALECAPCKTKGSMLQHVPTRGCIVAPGVEIFREPSSCGYGFYSQPVQLAGVISVAMFNRNPAISDSPVDCPSDPLLYIQQTKAKLQSAVEAAIELAAEVLVMPDVGCGVFQNDPAIIGGCLGAALRECGASSSFREVVITSHSEFSGACGRALRGEDPRPVCQAGAGCPELADERHAASFSHEGVPLEVAYEDEDAVTAALVRMAEFPKEIRKPMCRYGLACRNRTPEHAAKYDHPSTEDRRDRKEAMGGRVRVPERQPPLPSPSPTGRRSRGPGELEPPHLPPVPSRSPRLGREACRYGRKCYNRNPDHLARFSHPGEDDVAGGSGGGSWGVSGGGLGATGGLGSTGRRGARSGSGTAEPSHPAAVADPGAPDAAPPAPDAAPPAPPPESPPPASPTMPPAHAGCGGSGEPPTAPPVEPHSPTQQEKAFVHTQLDKLKASSRLWEEVIAALQLQPGLVNVRPNSRNFGFIHFAAHHVLADPAKQLIELGADPGLLTRDGKTAVQVLQDAMRQKPARNEKERQSDMMLLQYLEANMGGAAARQPAVQAKAGGNRLEVKGCSNSALNGVYREITAKSHARYPSYCKESPQHFLYYSKSLGWVIDGKLLLDVQHPMAYLGEHFFGDEVWLKPVTEDWRVWEAILEVYMPNMEMRVMRCRAPHHPH